MFFYESNQKKVEEVGGHFPTSSCLTFLFLAFAHQLCLLHSTFVLDITKSPDFDSGAYSCPFSCPSETAKSKNDAVAPCHLLLSSDSTSGNFSPPGPRALFSERTNLERKGKWSFDSLMSKKEICTGLRDPTTERNQDLNFSFFQVLSSYFPTTSQLPFPP